MTGLHVWWCPICQKQFERQHHKTRDGGLFPQLDEYHECAKVDVVRTGLVSFLVDEAIERWNEMEPGWHEQTSLPHWLGLTTDEYAAFVECRWDDLAASVIARTAS